MTSYIVVGSPENIYDCGVVAVHRSMEGARRSLQAQADKAGLEINDDGEVSSLSGNWYITAKEVLD